MFSFLLFRTLKKRKEERMAKIKRRRTYLTSHDFSLLLFVVVVVGLVLLMVRKDVEKRHVVTPTLSLRGVTASSQKIKILDGELRADDSVVIFPQEELSVEETKARSVGMTWERTLPLSVTVVEDQKK